MPSNPTWDVGGRRPVHPALKKKGGGGGGWVRKALMFVVAACAGALFLFSLKIVMRTREVASTTASLVDDPSVPEFGQAAVNAHADAVAGGSTSLRALAGPGPLITRRKRRIILSDGQGKWNTGVWPGWGYDPRRSTLNWAAAGVVVDKYCPVECEFTRDQDESGADAVVMELVNHPKFGIPESVPIPWPSPRPNPRVVAGGPRPTALPASVPLSVLFYYEAAQSYPRYTLQSADVASHIDISVTPSQDSTLPITMVCPWGKDVFDFMRVPGPGAKKPGRLLAYFNEHGIAREYGAVIDELFALAGDKLHSYIHKRNREMPPEAGGDPYQLSTRLAYLGTYKFVLVTESIVEDDWVEPDLSQVFLAGAVPVYIGAPNAVDYAPGPRSFIHIRDFPSARALWEYLASFEDDSPESRARYAEFFSWKAHAMTVHMQDEAGSKVALGTGHGVASRFMPQAKLQAQMQKWAVVPQPGGGAPKTLQQLQAANAGDASVVPYEDVAEAAWRNYRRQLDRCVHYAECRICELVTLLT